MDNKTEFSPYNALKYKVLQILDSQCEPFTLPTEYDISRFRTLGNDLKLLFWNISQLIQRHYRTPKERDDMYSEYVSSDKITLRDLGGKYNISRERVRQLINKRQKRNRGILRKLIKQQDETAVASRDEFFNIIRTTVDEFPAFTYYGFDDSNKRVLIAAFSLFFDDNSAKALKNVLTSYRKAFDKLDKQRTVSIKKIISWNELKDKIFFGASMIEDSCVPKETYTQDVEHRAYVKFQSILDELSDDICYTKNPNIVYYVSEKTTHRPDFMIHTPEGRYVLVVTCPTLNMSFSYNIKRFNALHRFCVQNGYGYLVIDDKRNSIYDIKRFNVGDKIKKALDGVLDEKRCILWTDIAALKKSLKITNKDVAAYVLQKKLLFTTKPLCITRQNNLI